LEKGLKVKEFELRKRNFSDTGNFGFGTNLNYCKESKNTLIWESNTTLTPVFSEWTSTWFWLKPEEEFPREGDVKTDLEPNKK
jgi:hypothetical protein